MGGGDEGGEVEESAARKHDGLTHFTEKQKIRMREVSKKYKESKDTILLRFLEENHLYEFKNTKENRHSLYIPKIQSSHPMYESYKLLSDGKANMNKGKYDRIKESMSLSLALNMPLKDNYAASMEDRDLKAAYMEAAGLQQGIDNNGQ